MRLFVHDYAGHPFAFELSRELARRGHVVRHAYFAGDQGPKGETGRRQDDPEGFSIAPLSLDRPYSKTDLIRRHRMDGQYGRVAAAALSDFRPDLVLAANTPLNALPAMQKAAADSGARFTLWLQDSFGLAAAALLKDRWRGAGRAVGAVYLAWERAMLRRADGVVAISDDFLPYLDGAGVAAAKIAVIPNWGPLSAIPQRSKDNAWTARHGLRGKRVLAYTAP
ncbi:MAG: glycosyltransferase [Caulobacteraceae bacterium]